MDKGIYTNIDPYNGGHKQPFPSILWIRTPVILSYTHVYKHIHRGDIYGNVYKKSKIGEIESV